MIHIINDFLRQIPTNSSQKSYNHKTAKTDIRYIAAIRDIKKHFQNPIVTINWY